MERTSPAGWLDDQVVFRPRQPALHIDGERLLFEDLWHRVEGLGVTLRAHGVGPGDTIAVASPDAGLTALLVYAVPRIGAALFPLNPHFSPEWQRRLLRQAGVTHVVGELPFPAALRMVPAAELSARSNRPVPAVAVAPLAAEDIHLIVSTSGSGGEPKGVMLTGRNLGAAVAASRRRLALEPGNCWLDCLPLFHMGGLSILYRAMEAGASVRLSLPFEASRVWAELNEGGITHLSLVPAMLERLLREAGGKPAPRSLRIVLMGGGPMSTGMMERALARGWPICVSYGLSETSSQVATLCNPGAGWPEGSVGRPLDGFGVEVLAPSGEVGRIRVSGDAVMAGYANPDHHFGDGLDEAGRFVTGDLGRIDVRGQLTVIGRADDVIVTGGENVHPDQIEKRLADCPGIEDVAVLGDADPVWGEIVVAFYVGRPREEEVEAWCRAHLPASHRPRRFKRVTSLLRNAMGKLERRRLRQWLEP